VSRISRLFGAILAAVISWVFSAWFGINGPNYDGWSRAFAVFVAVILLTLVVALIKRPPFSRPRVTVATVAVVVVAVLVAVTIHWYGDGTPQSDIPSILAWIGLAALTIAAGAMSIPLFRRGAPG
jgi:peptidoglycan/LPS O-acetylase OafA/YrhL